MKSRLSDIIMMTNMLLLDTPQNSKRSYKPQPIKPLPPKGKSFIINGVEIYALNKKNTKRKYNNLINKL